MKTTSFRLDNRELERIEKLAREEGEDKSQSVRELLDYGWEYMMIRRYKDGKLSLSRLSQELEEPISEVIDLLADLGIQSPLEKDEVMEGYEALRQEY
ncbi:ribbon-helix-helix protein, CopG family [Candidatus Bipolaricaulota bacterium]|nr:ribbon-helix-helix protein, CopG family [Candidatus Bipolaricaulota bacterium]MBS3792906.1 ribbon-helix-helix protein, CopG family [Candidatus Bipolaricaulota bacterium]